MKRRNADKALGVAISLAICGLAILGFLAGFQFHSSNVTSDAVVLGEDKIVRSIPILSVDEAGYGAVAILTVEVREGSGKVLVNIDNILSYPDTQESSRFAVLAAENYIGKSLDNVDIIFSIKSDAGIVSGGSAGSAMAVALTKALLGEEIDNDVAISGTISADGQIGEVGGLLAKAEAASEDYDLLLVPDGQSSQQLVQPIQECENVGRLEFCRLRYTYEVVSLQDAVGIDVVEVSNLAEALEYF